MPELNIRGYGGKLFEPRQTPHFIHISGDFSYQHIFLLFIFSEKGFGFSEFFLNHVPEPLVSRSRAHEHYQEIFFQALYYLFYETVIHRGRFGYIAV